MNGEAFACYKWMRSVDPADTCTNRFLLAAWFSDSRRKLTARDHTKWRMPS